VRLCHAVLLPLPEMVRGGEVEAYDERGLLFRWKRITMPSKTLMERWLEKVRKEPNGCWIWTGGILRTRYQGYGRIKIDGKQCRAHRVGYELLIGKVPAGLVLDHLCRTPACVNPDHLEPVTSGENVLRGAGPPAMHARQTHCLVGHEFSGVNLGVSPQGYRYCKECKRISDRAQVRGLSNSQYRILLGYSR
jgi:hypothetical protein